MITIKYDTTTVTFGKDGIATIGLIDRKGKVIMQHLVNESRIGKSFDITKDVSEFPKVVLEFNEVSSVDSLIKVLEKVKEKMQVPEYYYYAC
jgi:hypothetical protein